MVEAAAQIFEVEPYKPSIEAPPSKAQRDLMERELIALAESYLSRMDEMQELETDSSVEGYRSCYYNDPEAGHVTCSTYRVLEDEPRLIAAFNEMQGGLDHNNKICERVTATELALEEGGRRIVSFHTKTPMMTSNRIMFSTEYRKELESGEIIATQSSRGNEFYYEKFKSRIGFTDVIPNHIISMTKFKPLEDGSGV